jgi:UDPglucose--hexose-1-phosphate uridylyltransferase
MKKDSINIQGQIRRDFFNRVVIITPVRAARPHDFKEKLKPKKIQKPSECFFCPGNENLTPPELDRTMLEGNKTWLNRVFFNRFPALSPEWKEAYGYHEILVETPDHKKTLSDLNQEEIFYYLKMIKKRILFRKKDKKIKFASVFKNEWPDAGASLEHTHTQLLFMPFVPDYIKIQQRALGKNCHLCKLEKNNLFPKIFSTKNFLFVAPYVPKYKYETWIVPKKHISSLVDLDDSLLDDLAKILLIAIKTQDSYLNYPPYNILYHLGPLNSKNFHFHISLTPRIAKWAGFEHQTGVILNSIPPEVVAQEYKLNLKL